jgi:hypothetical protein
MQILITEPVYNLMSLKARHTLRKIDVIIMKETKESQSSKDPMGIYTFDISFQNSEDELGIGLEEERKMGDLIKLPDYENINIASFTNRGVDYMFTLDADIVGL